MSRRLEVLLHDRPVGEISETPDGGTEFRFSSAYRDLAPRPILGQKFEDDLEKVYHSRRGQGLPDFFANLIPEGRLRNLIEESGGLEEGDDLALLAFVGRDLPGAVTIQALDEGAGPSTMERPDLPVRAEEAEIEDGLRFSLAGVQLKFSMLLKGDKLTLPARNSSGEWIVKFDSVSFPSLPENEFSMLEWARAIDIEVPECQLHSVNDVEGFPRRYATAGTKVLAIRRYDRLAEGLRIHQEDFAQAVGLPPRKKYDHVTYEAMALLAQRFIDESAAQELLRRLVFVIASGNNDAHLKNWSLIYPDGIRARWSPLYDQVATVAWQEPSRQLALNLASIKEFGRIDGSSFERFSKKAQMDQRIVLKLVEETLEQLRAAWRSMASNLPLPEEHKAALRNHWRQVPLLRAAGSLD
ncbi:MAG TPA: HipA domain-containing protein [Thermoanaerobaculia bacterium]|jgi:serine/threonine-protein kinase HipA|nr:HipA domain-containing protein [Thermoanaerobaculia bacterium]